MNDGRDYHVVLNPDVSFTASTLQALRSYMDENSLLMSEMFYQLLSLLVKNNVLQSCYPRRLF